jgi:hypothetical protein
MHCADAFANDIKEKKEPSRGPSQEQNPVRITTKPAANNAAIALNHDALCMNQAPSLVWLFLHLIPIKPTTIAAVHSTNHLAHSKEIQKQRQEVQR